MGRLARILLRVGSWGVLAGLIAGPAWAQFTYRGNAGSSVSLSTRAVPSGVRALEAQVTPLAGGAGSLGLVLHHQDASNHYLFLFSTNSAALMIYRKVAGTYTLLASQPVAVALGQSHVLRAEDDGSGGLRLLWDGTPRVAAQDSSFVSGDVGLRVWNMTADFDDVLASDAAGSTLLFDDFEDGQAEGWSGGAGWQVIGGGGGPSMPVPTVDTNFEGGNVEVTFIDTANWTLHLRPELKGSSPYRAWFYFKLSGLSPLRATNLIFNGVSFFTRPYYSYDRENWLPLPGGGSSYALVFDQDPIWIAHSIPYQTEHLERLIDDVAGPSVDVGQLALSEGGLPVSLLRIGNAGGGGACGVWLTARQHAWEASGSWVADRFVRWLVSSDPRAQELRLAARIHVVPIMDVDNVALGGSGKDQQPIDFNRDWRAGAHWAAVDAAIEAIRSFEAQHDYHLFIDSHCPGSATTFLAVQPDELVTPAYWSRFLRFKERLDAHSATYSGAIAEWGPGYHPLWYQMSFWHQFDQHPELSSSLTLETAVGSLDSYHDVGRALGLALRDRLPCVRGGPRRGLPLAPPR